MNTISPITSLQQALIERQRKALHRYTGSDDDSFVHRMNDYRRYGTQTLQTILYSAGISESDFARCTEAHKNDPRFEFLGRLAQVAAMGGALGDVLEKSIYGTNTGQARHITALVGMFTRLLDSLVDDAPELIFADREMLFALAGKEAWQTDVVFPGDDELIRRHPVVSLLYKIMREAVRRIKTSEAWINSEGQFLREVFASAAEQALVSEFKTMNCRISERSGNYDPTMRAVLVEKSESMMLVMGLAPLLHLGSHVDFSHEAYVSAIRAMGVTFGWIDDITDTEDDCGDGNWSEVLMQLYDEDEMPAYEDRAEFTSWLRIKLAAKGTIDNLAKEGVIRYRTTAAAIRKTGNANDPLLRFFNDAMISWLSPQKE